MSVREQMKIHTVDENIYWYSQFGKFKLKKKKTHDTKFDIGIQAQVVKSIKKRKKMIIFRWGSNAWEGR